MNTTKRSKFSSLLLAGIFSMAIAALFAGCQSNPVLDPNGVYQGDTFLFNADSQIKLDQNALAAFVGWEYTNHAAIQATWPGVVTAANQVRANAPAWFAAVGAVRADYIFVRQTVGDLTNSAALDAAKTNLLSSITVLGAKVSDAQNAVNTTALANKPKLQ